MSVLHIKKLVDDIDGHQPAQQLQQRQRHAVVPMPR